MSNHFFKKTYNFKIHQGIRVKKGNTKDGTGRIKVCGKVTGFELK